MALRIPKIYGVSQADIVNNARATGAQWHGVPEECISVDLIEPEECISVDLIEPEVLDDSDLPFPLQRGFMTFAAEAQVDVKHDFARLPSGALAGCKNCGGYTR